MSSSAPPSRCAWSHRHDRTTPQPCCPRVAVSSSSWTSSCAMRSSERSTRRCCPRASPRRRRRRIVAGRSRRRSPRVRQVAPDRTAGILHDRGRRSALVARGRCGGRAHGHRRRRRAAELPRARLDRGRPQAAGDRGRSLGRALARLHATGAPSFGRADRRTTGSRALPNEPCATWAEFYATQRLLPLARLARDAGAVQIPVIEALEHLAGRLDAVRWRRRSAGAAPRRPVVGQSDGRSRRCELADRPGGARRAPRVRPGDDAPVRRVRRRLPSPPTPR